MKANELMIGDWVNFNTIEYPRFGMVNAINGNGLIEICHYTFESEVISPIPLTEEILNANCWEEKAHMQYRHNCHICIDLLDDSVEFDVYNYFDSFPNCKIDMRIRYVHELQHALRLCGLSDLADNFKIE